MSTGAKRKRLPDKGKHCLAEQIPEDPRRFEAVYQQKNLKIIICRLFIDAKLVIEVDGGRCVFKEEINLKFDRVVCDILWLRLQSAIYRRSIDGRCKHARLVGCWPGSLSPKSRTEWISDGK